MCEDGDIQPSPKCRCDTSFTAQRHGVRDRLLRNRSSSWRSAILNSGGTSTGRFFNLAAYVAEQPERSAEVAPTTRMVMSCVAWVPPCDAWSARVCKPLCIHPIRVVRSLSELSQHVKAHCDVVFLFLRLHGNNDEYQNIHGSSQRRKRSSSKPSDEVLE